MHEQKSPWSTIWYDPKGTIREIMDSDPKRNIILLAALGGISQGLSNVAGRGMGDTYSVATLVTLSILLGPLGGFLTLYLGGYVIQWTSRWLGGNATREQIHAAIAWSWVPIVEILPIWIVKYILFREEAFTSKTPFIDSHGLLSTLNGIINFVEVGITVWSLLILYSAIGEVNRFSAWRGFGAVLLSGLIIGLPLLLLLSILAPSLGM